MPIVAVFQSPKFTREIYEQTVRRMTGGKKARMDAVADWPVKGILAHIAGESATGFRVVDVWDSEESFRKFGDTLIPIMKELGVDGAPEIYPAHAFVSA